MDSSLTLAKKSARAHENKSSKEKACDHIEPIDPIEQSIHTSLVALGEDPSREGLLDTPHRVAKAWRYLTKGYEESLDDIINGAIFHEPNAQHPVIVRDIDLFSLCEHHMLPFYGKVHIAYWPTGKVLGLSKLARISDHFSRRLQIQERLSQQIAQAIYDLVDPKGVLVCVEAAHMCMAMRGVQKPTAMTSTISTVGCYHEDTALRTEILAQLRASKS